VPPRERGTDAVVEWTSLCGPDADDVGPDIVVRGDGRVTLCPRLGGGRRVEARIPAERAVALLRSIVDEHRFFDLDPRDPAADRDRPPAERREGEAVHVPLGPPYVDAGTTRLRVAAGGREREVSVHGLHAAAREHPDDAALQALRAIELDLLALADELSPR
jgi:hypothetical protein